MQLITEQISTKTHPFVINESLTQEGGNLFVEGVIATAEEKNGNGRYYAKELWEREISKFTSKIAANSTEACGELDHPDSQVINLKNSSHVFRKVWWDGNLVHGLIEIFCSEGRKGNPAGRIAGSYFYNKLLTGISSRGMGSLNETTGGIMEVQDDFELITFDLVSTPSNHGSFMVPANNSIHENKISIIKNYNIINQIATEILCANGTCPIF